jgi:putative Mn2+ efflux pump MntP
MSFWEILLISFGVSMDAFAVAVSAGTSHRLFRFRQALLMALFFGGFQTIMPLLGWCGGYSCKHLIETFDHWVAFVLLLLVGGKMMYESVQHDDKNDNTNNNSFKIGLLFVLALATSIDALAVGVSLSFVNVPLFLPVTMMGIITFFMALLGTYIGRAFGHLFEKKCEFAGGLIIVIIGGKIIFDHLSH